MKHFAKTNVYISKGLFGLEISGKFFFWGIDSVLLGVVH